MDSESRKKQLADMYRSGMTLQEIGLKIGVTRQRVQWLIARIGIGRNDGGYEKQRYKLHGFSSLTELQSYEKRFPDCHVKYLQQRNNAKRRGLEWGFTLKTWLDVWSDQWNLRGIGGESLVMCRRNDVGPYSPGNVFIATCGQNASEYQQRVWRDRKVDRYSFPLPL